MESPPVAGALREHPKGQDPPRKAGTGANAVVRHRLLEPLRLVSVSLRLATAPSQICPGSVTPPFEGRLVNVAKCRQLSRSRDICPLECYGLPLSLPPLLPLAPLPASACSTPGRPLLFRALPEGRPPRRTRSARRLQAGSRWVPGRDGYPDGEAAPVLASPGSHRRQAEGALLSLADKAIEVMKAALAANDTRVAEWIIERAVVRPHQSLSQYPLAGYNL